MSTPTLLHHQQHFIKFEPDVHFLIKEFTFLVFYMSMSLVYMDASVYKMRTLKIIRHI